MHPTANVLKQPYLLDAMIGWILSNNALPYLLVDCDHVDVRAPAHLKGPTAFNLSPRAIVGFRNDDWGVSFSARFNGVSQIVSAPWVAVQAIYSPDLRDPGVILKQGTHGIYIGPTVTAEPPEVREKSKEPEPKKSSFLKVVK